MNVIVAPLLQVLDFVLELYQIVVVIWVVLHWLAVFKVVNSSNSYVSLAMDVLGRLVYPAILPIRRVVPFVGGVDFSPLVLLLLIYFLRNVIGRMIYNLNLV